MNFYGLQCIIGQSQITQLFLNFDVRVPFTNMNGTNSIIFVLGHVNETKSPSISLLVHRLLNVKYSLIQLQETRRVEMSNPDLTADAFHIKSMDHCFDS